MSTIKEQEHITGIPDYVKYSDSIMVAHRALIRIASHIRTLVDFSEPWDSEHIGSKAAAIARHEDLLLIRAEYGLIKFTFDWPEHKLLESINAQVERQRGERLQDWNLKRILGIGV